MKNDQRGFIKYIILFVLVGLAISVFNIDLQKIADSKVFTMAARGVHALVEFGGSFVDEYNSIDEESATTTDALSGEEGAGDDTEALQ